LKDLETSTDPTWTDLLGSEVAGIKFTGLVVVQRRYSATDLGYASSPVDWRYL
jgi:hypothetical protein